MDTNLLDIISTCDDDPSAVFPLINRGEMDTVKYLLDKNIVNINTVDSNGNDVLVRLLKLREYTLVLRYMKKKNWDVNKQNIDGDTFGHILASLNDPKSIKVFDTLIRKKNFIPNIKNNKGETLLDKSKDLIPVLKIIEDKRFNNIDLYEFKKLFRLSIDNDDYGKYSRLSNFDLILNSLGKKDLQPNMELLTKRMKDNKEAIKSDIMNNSIDIIRDIVNSTIEEVN